MYMHHIMTRHETFKNADLDQVWHVIKHSPLYKKGFCMLYYSLAHKWQSRVQVNSNWQYSYVVLLICFLFELWIHLDTKNHGA